MTRILFLTAMLWMNAIMAHAQENFLEKKLAQIYINAAAATAEGDIEHSDFWIARYMGLTAFNEDTNRGYPDLIPLFKKRDDLKPTAFISGKYDDSFIEFYVRGTYGLWGVPEERVDEEKGRFIIEAYSDDRYFVEVSASPRLENWYILKTPQVMTVIPLGAGPVIQSGMFDKGKRIALFKEMPFNGEDSFIHYVWPIETHDLDGDGTPEIWVRYMKAWADGFSQELAIYMIKDDSELLLLKQFSGDAEGIARRLEGNKVEVGTGFTEKNVGHTGFDQTHLEIWEYKDGSFIKTSERDVSHVLWSTAWEQYYFKE